MTVCLSYIMMKEKKPFDVVFNESKSKRGISSPNIGFQVQLMKWHKRLFEPYESIIVRAFAIGSHQLEQPHRVVARMLDKFSLDRRGVFVVQTAEKTFIWQGSEVHPANLDKYLHIASVHAKRLQKFENGTDHVELIEEGSEPPDFWDCGRANPDINPEWDKLYLELDKVQDQQPKSYRELEEEDEDPKEKVKSQLFCYPELEGIKVFDDEELEFENLYLLCSDSKCFIWRGPEFEPDEMEEEEYIAAVKKQFYGDRRNIEVQFEEPCEESPEFTDKMEGFDS